MKNKESKGFSRSFIRAKKLNKNLLKICSKVMSRKFIKKQNFQKAQIKSG